jgi:hypothetical protein
MAMDTAARFAPRQVEPIADASAPSPTERERALRVAVTYLLSEQGRKASLLSGGDGRAMQQMTVTVPAGRLHLVTVDDKGVARLKLRPSFERDAQQRVVVNDAPPTYEAPPTVDDLFRDAARNHQLERAYHAERSAAKIKHLDVDFELRIEVAQAFLNDRSRRAVERPTPAPTHCFVIAEGGRRLRFDVTDEEGSAREVPPEAYRRFNADLRARRERGRQQRFMDDSQYDDKRQFIAQWIAMHGTVDQQARHAAGKLSMEEAAQAMADHTFAVLKDQPRYLGIDEARLQAHLRQFRAYADAVVTAADLAITVAEARSATEAQWERLQQLGAAVPGAELPGAEVILRAHKVGLKEHPNGPTLMAFGVRVTRKVGPFVLKREYAAPDV